jgi:hypothetical protein
MRRFSAMLRLNKPASWKTTAMALRNDVSLTSRMSMPSMVMATAVGIAQTLQKAQAWWSFPIRCGRPAHGLPGRRLEIEMVDAEMTIGKGEGEFLVADPPPDVRQGWRAGPVGDQARRVDEIEIGVDGRLLIEEAENEARQLIEP